MGLKVKGKGDTWQFGTWTLIEVLRYVRKQTRGNHVQSLFFHPHFSFFPPFLSISCTNPGLNKAINVWIKGSTYLHRHGPQVGAEEEKPHQLVGLYSHQVVDLPQCHFPHRHVGGGQTQDFVVYHRLGNETKYIYISKQSWTLEQLGDRSCRPFSNNT